MSQTRSIAPGSTSQSVYPAIYNDDGTANTSLVFNSSSLSASYQRDNAAAVAITLVTLASDTAAYSSGGFVLSTPGYRLDVPNAAFAAGASVVRVKIAEATNIRAEPIVIVLDNTVASRLSSTDSRLPASAASGTYGGLSLQGYTKSDDVYRLLIETAAKTVSAVASDSSDLVFTTASQIVVTVGGNAGNFSGAAVGDWLVFSAGQGASPATANELQARQITILSNQFFVGTGVTTQKINVSPSFSTLPAESDRFLIVSASQWTQMQATLAAQGYTTGRAGNLDNLDAAVSSRLAATSYAAPDNADIVTALSDLVTLLGRTDPNTALAAVKAVTDKLATMINGSNQFTAPALALGPASTTVVLPVAAQSTPTLYVTRDLPQIPEGTAPAFAWTVVDGTGAAVNLSGKTLRFVASSVACTSTSGVFDPWSETLTPLFKHETGGNGITVGGTSSNVATVQLTAGDTAAAVHARYWLLNVTDNLVLATGRLPIVPASLNYP